MIVGFIGTPFIAVHCTSKWQLWNLELVQYGIPISISIPLHNLLIHKLAPPPSTHICILPSLIFWFAFTISDVKNSCLTLGSRRSMVLLCFLAALLSKASSQMHVTKTRPTAFFVPHLQEPSSCNPGHSSSSCRSTHSTPGTETQQTPRRTEPKNAC